KPLPTFEPVGHDVSSAVIFAAEHVLSALPLKVSSLPMCTTALVAGDGASFTSGVVLSFTTSFVFFGFFFVPCEFGETVAVIPSVGLIAELTAAPMPPSARAPVTA